MYEKDNDRYNVLEVTRDMKQKSFFVASLLMVIIAGWLMAGCGAQPAENAMHSTSTSTVTLSVTEQAEQNPTLISTPAPTSTATALPKPTVPPLFDPDELSQQLASSIAQITTPRGGSAGFLVEGNYLITSADVVWPFETVDVIFADGEKFGRTPVIQLDLIANLALVGPVSTDAQPVLFADDIKAQIGDNVFLLSNRNPTGEMPRLEVVEKEVREVWQWNKAGLEYFKIKALNAEMPAGGLLFSATGKFIGFSNSSVVDNLFGYMLSAADIAPRLNAMLSGKNVDGLSRSLEASSNKGSKLLKANVPYAASLPTFVLWEKPGTKVNLSIVAEEKKGFRLQIVSVRGILENLDYKKLAFENKADFTTHLDAPYFLQAFSNLDTIPNAGVIASSHPWVAYKDPDDQRNFAIDSEWLGNCDFPGDRDIFLVSLKQGERIRTHVESGMYAPLIVIMNAESENPGKILAKSIDDGPVGTTVDFTASDEGMYLIVVASKHFSDIGGYYLTIESP